MFEAKVLLGPVKSRTGSQPLNLPLISLYLLSIHQYYAQKLDKKES